MISAFDEQMLRRALRVAMNGRGRVEPNPMVGCVLTKNDQIIAEGWHTHFGGPHAEPTALADCQARGNDPRGATAYVTLEPCCHTNKKTPPCAPKLIEAGIARVVIGCLDPNPDVDGKGVLMLEKHAIQVDTAPPELAALFRQLIAPFTADRYTTLKWAETADGRVAGPNGVPIRITSPASDLAVHRLRTRSDAIAVGIKTVLKDDPSLTVRGVDVIRRPHRIVIDRQFRIPEHCRLLNEMSHKNVGARVTILVSPEALKRNPEKAIRISDHSWAEAWPLQKNNDLQCIWDTHPFQNAELNLLVEPGPTLAAAALPWADRLWVFRSSQCGGMSPTSPKASEIPSSYVETGRIHIGPDTLIEYLNRDAASFVTATPSADFVLEAERAASL